MSGSSLLSLLAGVPLLGDQPISSLSHLLAACAALVAAIPLVKLGRGCRRRRLALATYAVCVIVPLAISGIYHSLEVGSSARDFMQRVDHGAIWFLIAGTFTGVHGVMWQGFWRKGVLSFVWCYALVGLLLQIFWFGTFRGNLGLALYLGLGWIGILSMYKLGRQIGWITVLPVLYAGIAYSGGAILEAFKWPVLIESWVGAHEIFHLAVIAGVSLHWLFIRRLLLYHAPALTPPIAPIVPVVPIAVSAP